jgi:hypothetical protein
MSNQNKQIIGKYSDQEIQLAKRFYQDTELFQFVKNNLLKGITGTEALNGDFHIDWMNQVAVKHIGVPLQSGAKVDSEAFTQEAMAKYAGINLIEEIFARYEIVANFEEKEKEAKKKPSLK